MRQSHLFTKTFRTAPKDEEATNARLLIQGGFIDKLMAGVYTYLPLGLRVFKKVEHIIREEMDAAGGTEVLMPSLQPKDNWEKTGRWTGMDDLYKVKDSSGRETALGPTHEEVVAPLAKKFVSSYKDLPFAPYQIQNKFRMEHRSKSGILRGREFVMKDMYSFHTDEADLDAFYEKMKKVYTRVFERVGIGAKTYMTFASGGTFSKFSHEFQTETDAGEDVIHVCEKCRIAVNREVIDVQPACPECGNGKLIEKKAIEVGNIFKLMTKFSAPFELTYRDKDGEEQAIIMGCYGIGLGRVMGTVVEVSHDDKGIIWPASIAPFAVHLIEIGEGLGTEVYEKLSAAGIEVLYDDRPATPGEKFADADLIGLPFRAVVSQKTGDRIEVKRRRETAAALMTLEDLMTAVRTAL